MVDPLFFLAHIMAIGCPSYVSRSCQPTLRPSVFRHQYLPAKLLGGISQVFKGLIDPLSELCKNFHFIKKSGCHGNETETLSNLVKDLWLDFQGDLVKLVLGTPSTKIVEIILIGLKCDHQMAWPFFQCQFLFGESFLS